MIWESKGCAICRKMWESGNHPRCVGISPKRQTYLHRCDVCMCYWEQCERSANIISQQEARRFYHEYIQEVSDMNEFSPLNKLESMLLAAKQGRVPVNEFLQQLWSSEIALPTANEVEMDGFGFAPIFFDKEGVSMLAAFTSKDRVGQLAAIAKYCMVMNGGEVLRRMPKGHGLVVNPGLHVGFEISPSGIAEIVSEYG